MAHLRKDGYLCQVVETYRGGRRHDLWGFIDILALRAGETLAVQTTSGSNFSARKKKILTHENYQAVKDAGWVIVVHGWRKNAKGRWVLREERL
jgi:hypothetical protein